jgi:drug/metabolite transporter (DMT)-like permease
LDPIVFGLGVLISLSFGTSDFLSKDVTSKIGAYKTTVYILAISGMVTLFPGFVLNSSFVFSALSVFLLLFISVTTYVAFLALYQAYSKGMLSLTAPIANSYPAFSILLSVLLIGASFSLGSIWALVAIMIGIVLVSTSLSDLRRRLFGRGKALAPGVGSAVISAIFFGASWTAFGYASQTFGFLLPAIAIRLGAAVVGFGVAPALRQEVRPVFIGSLPRLCLMSSLEAAGAILYSLGAIISSSPDAIPILSTFSGISAAVTVVLAILFLRERLELNHIIGILMLIGGIVLLLRVVG